MKESSANNLSVTEQLLLSLISNSLFGVPIDIPSNADWESVIYEAKVQAVLPLVFHEMSILPNEMHSAMEKQLMTMIANNIRIESNHAYAHKLMTDAEIPYVILKGCASAHYYPEPIFRMMGDVDLLVAEEELGPADEALRKNGFQSWNENHICHVVYQKTGVQIELHWEPAGMPEGTPGEVVRSYMNDIFATAVEADAGCGKIMIPDDFHHGLVLLLHTCHHLTGEGIGLRHLCDWAVFADHIPEDRFRTLFEERLKAIGLWRFAQLLTQLSAKYLGMPAKEWASENIDDVLLSAMMRDIFDGGNFGAKDSQRRHETVIISSRGKNGVGHSSLIRQFIQSIDNIIYLKWPASKKCKLLLPFGWIFYGCRYAVKIMTGKRSIPNAKKIIAGAKKRRELYKAFHLYEV